MRKLIGLFPNGASAPFFCPKNVYFITMMIITSKFKVTKCVNVLMVSAILIGVMACNDTPEKISKDQISTEQSSTQVIPQIYSSMNVDQRCAAFEVPLANLQSPGVAIMVTSSQEILLHCVYGHRSSNKSSPISVNDKWHIGSNTKAMTAFLVARLEQKGVIAWDDTVGSTFKSMFVPESYMSVTYPDLLTHTSGVSADINPFLRSTYRIDDDSGVPSNRLGYASEIFKNPRASDDFVYSNAGYIIAGAMLEAKTGESWETLMQAHVFEPLGMGSAGFGPPGGKGATDQPKGHISRGLVDLPVPVEMEFADNPIVYGPAGRVHLSLSDYAKYLQVNLKALRDKPQNMLSESNIVRLFDSSKNNYAMGWGMRGGIYQHSGSNTLWHTIILMSPTQDRAVVISTNFGDTKRQTPVFLDVARSAVDATTGSP